MRKTLNSRQSISRQEDGFLLLGVLFMVLLITMALAIAAPRVAESIRRDKEIETVHRGMQYVRAIQIYYNKYGRYPNTIDQLLRSDNQRFLRKRYLDPITGKDDWRLIHYGEQRVLTQGLFGQALGQTGAITTIGVTNGTGSTGSGTSSSPFGASGSLSSSGSSFGSSGGSSSASSGSSFGPGSSTSPFGSSGQSSSSISGTDSGSSSVFGSTTGVGSPATGSINSAIGSLGVNVGSAPIVGVGLLDKTASIRIYKKQNHYNKWEFVYDPNQNTAAVGAVNGDRTRSIGVNGSASGYNGNGSGPPP